VTAADTVEVRGFSVKGTEADVLAADLLSPEYAAVTPTEPFAANAVLQVATPPMSG
jgi:hypothetical protein